MAPHTGQPQHEANGANRPAPAGTAIRRGLFPSKDDGGDPPNAKEGFLGIPYDGWVAIFTGLLTVGTIGLWYATDRTVRLGRDGFNATHRPKLIIRDVFPIWENETAKILFTVVNVGDTPATVLESCRFAEISSDGELVINPRSKGYSDLGNLELAPGEHRDFDYLMPFDTRMLTVAMNMDRTTLGGVHFTGSILYADPDGRRRRMVFRRRYTADGRRFRPIDDAEHEYSD